MVMMTKRASFADARSQVRAALAAMGRGRPEDCIDCWAISDDATLFGAWDRVSRVRAAQLSATAGACPSLRRRHVKSLVKQLKPAATPCAESGHHRRQQRHEYDGRHYDSSDVH